MTEGISDLDVVAHSVEVVCSFDSIVDPLADLPQDVPGISIGDLEEYLDEKQARAGVVRSARSCTGELASPSRTHIEQRSQLV